MMGDRRRCEACGSTMPPRMHRQMNDEGKKVCPSCIRMKRPTWASLVAFEQADGNPDFNRGYISGYHGSEKLPGQSDEYNAGYAAGKAAQVTASIKLAHDSGDGETIYHCPFCGAGSVVGSSNGTVSCQFCKQNFTVQVQPEFKAMPQTVNGQPYNMPGMPGGGPDAGAAPQQQAADQAAAQDGAPPAPSPANSGDLNAAFEQATGGAPQPPAAPRPVPPGPARPAVAASYVVDGVTLSAQAYHQRLAIRHAEDREAVLAAVRRENGR